MSPLNKYTVVLVLGFIALFVQGAVLKSFAPESIIVPNLALILVVFLAFYDVSISAVVLCFLLGLEIDLGTGILLGPWAAAFVAVYGMVASISQRVFVDSPFAIAMAGLCSSVLASLVYLAFVFQFRPVAMDIFSFSFVMAVEAVLTAIIAPFAFMLLKKVLLPRQVGSASGRYRN